MGTTGSRMPAERSQSQEPQASEEIEITPEMIAAGEDALREFDLYSVAEGWDSKGDVAHAVYRAMTKAAPR